MKTPQELKDKMSESKFAKDMCNALKIVSEKIEIALKEGNVKIVLPTHMELGNLFYYDDKQDALAKKLLSMGYNCKKESNIIGGVRQEPIWHLHFE